MGQDRTKTATQATDDAWQRLRDIAVGIDSSRLGVAVGMMAEAVDAERATRRRDQRSLDGLATTDECPVEPKPELAYRAVAYATLHEPTWRGPWRRYIGEAEQDGARRIGHLYANVESRPLSEVSVLDDPSSIPQTTFVCRTGEDCKRTYEKVSEGYVKACPDEQATPAVSKAERANIPAGTIVELLSGGPKMVVTRDGGHVLSVAWAGPGGEILRDNLAVEALRVVTRPHGCGLVSGSFVAGEVAAIRMAIQKARFAIGDGAAVGWVTDADEHAKTLLTLVRAPIE